MLFRSQQPHTGLAASAAPRLGRQTTPMLCSTTPWEGRKLCSYLWKPCRIPCCTSCCLAAPAVQLLQPMLRVCQLSGEQRQAPAVLLQAPVGPVSAGLQPGQPAGMITARQVPPDMPQDKIFDLWGAGAAWFGQRWPPAWTACRLRPGQIPSYIYALRCSYALR